MVRDGDYKLVTEVNARIREVIEAIGELVTSDFPMTDGEAARYEHIYHLAHVQKTQAENLAHCLMSRTFEEQVGYEEAAMSGQQQREELERAGKPRRNAIVAP